MVFILNDKKPNKVCFGTAASQNSRGNRIRLFELDGRVLIEDLGPLPDAAQGFLLQGGL